MITISYKDLPPMTSKYIRDNFDPNGWAGFYFYSNRNCLSTNNLIYLIKLTIWCLANQNDVRTIQEIKLPEEIEQELFPYIFSQTEQ